uniref:[histone H3]-trimethyl-L-lysine(9) demethylase n=1 Tax=Steinernema glaseri TaxID=37863 RepID=A0A1I7ZUP0_9BILA
MVEKGKYDTNLASVPRGHQRKYNSKTVVLYPNAEQFKSFSGCVAALERRKAHLMSGIAKIVPPAGWHPRPKKRTNYNDIDNLEIRTPVREQVTKVGKHIYLKINHEVDEPETVSKFAECAKKPEYRNPVPEASVQETVQKYWEVFGQGTEAIYGADVEGSIYEDGVEDCNVGNLRTILDLLNEQKVRIPGVNTCYLYFGMWKTTFPWHAEDVDLYSINYLHFGAPKFWYAISSEYADRFERLANQMFPEQARECSAFMRHKNYQIHPDLLREHNIPFETMIQYPGEVIVTFPRGYHMGFNMGYNCAESTNFALDRWIDYGKNATVCKCAKGGVQIDMTPFMEKYRPQEVEPWRNYWYTCSTKPVIAPSNVQGESKLQTRQIRPVQQWMKGYDQKQFDVEKLWSDYSVDLENEAKFNEYRARCSPHCAICQYFWPDPLQTEKHEVPKSSPRAITDLIYNKGINPQGMSCYLYEELELFSDDLQRTLLQCISCKVVVHSSCYPCKIPEDQTIKRDQWKCMRCCEPNRAIREAAACHLCKLRGGALIRAKKGRDDGLFVHIVCALANRRTWFDDPIKKSLAITLPQRKQNSDCHDCPLREDYLNATPEYFHESLFECDLCGKLGEGLVMCVKCDEERPSLYHATCARAAGLTLQRRDWPTLTTLVCEHDMNAFSQNSQELFGDLNVDDDVIAWIDDGKKVLKGVVVGTSSTRCCAVEFMDCSSSSDVSPADIVACACKNTCSQLNTGEHIFGARVFVIWEDGMRYAAYFHGVADVKRYKIKIGPRTYEMSRDELYGPHDYIPQKVIDDYYRLNKEKEEQSVPPYKKQRTM